MSRKLYLSITPPHTYSQHHEETQWYLNHWNFKGNQCHFKHSSGAKGTGTGFLVKMSVNTWGHGVQIVLRNPRNPASLPKVWGHLPLPALHSWLENGQTRWQGPDPQQRDWAKGPSCRNLALWTPTLQGCFSYSRKILSHHRMSPTHPLQAVTLEKIKCLQSGRGISQSMPYP